MKNMNLLKIANACGGTLVCKKELEERNVAGVVLDSRQVEQDFLFIATKGEKVDSHHFIKQAFSDGALCVICEREPETVVPAYILVEDSFLALTEIATYYRSTLAVKMIGITGSVGKTSTKEFVASVLEKKYRVLKTVGNFNNEIGVPLTILKIREEHEVAVLEMGINHFGEMSRLTQVVRPDISVMTNIGQCHLEFLGTREGILKAKSEIFEGMTEDGNVCINGDDDMLQTIKEVYGKPPIRFGLSQHNTIFATAILDQGLLGTNCRIHVGKDSFAAKIPLSGQHMIYNALAATAVGNLLGLTMDEIAKGIAAVKSMSGRNNIIQTEKYVLIDDCYNANPVSVKAGIDLLTTARGRKVALLGDMMELGEESHIFHMEIGRYVVEKKIDVLLCVGTYSAYMQKGAIEEASKENSTIEIYYFTDKNTMMQQFQDIIQSEDTILIKASHSMGFETIVKALQEEH